MKNLPKTCRRLKWRILWLIRAKAGKGKVYPIFSSSAIFFSYDVDLFFKMYLFVIYLVVLGLSCSRQAL